MNSDPLSPALLSWHFVCKRVRHSDQDVSVPPPFFLAYGSSQARD